MKLNKYLLKLVIISFIIIKSSCLKENLTKKNTTIYLNYTSYFINSTIRTLSEKNFDSIISLNNNKSIDCLILFTLKRCPNCNHMIRLTENVEKYYSQQNNNLKFYKVDSYSNHFTAMRFDISKIPVYIYISQGFYAKFIPENQTEDELINFIENKNKEFLVFPDKIGYFGVWKKVIHNLTLKIQIKFNFWNDYLTWIVILITIFSFLYFEYKIYRVGCCNNKNKSDDAEQINQKNKKKNNNTDKKRIPHKHNYKEEKEDEDDDSISEDNSTKKKKFKKFKNKVKEE